MGEEQIRRFVRDLHGQSSQIIKRGDTPRETTDPSGHGIFFGSPHFASNYF